MNMNFEVAFVKDGGTHWVATNVINYDMASLDVGEQYVRISNEAAKEIKAALEAGFLVMLPKNLGREVRMLDVIIHKVDRLTAAKQEAKYLVLNTFDACLEALSIIDIYAFTAIFSKFAARGIFITDENVEKVKELYSIDKEQLKDRDDAYVDIIMANSQQDLEDLQTLVDAQDKMKRVYEIYNEVKEAQRKIDNAETLEEVTKIKELYFEKRMFPSL
jgi:hypothetical protein